MPEKIKKNLLGRTVVKKTSDDGRTVNRTVYGRDRQLVKSKTKISSDKGKSVTTIKGNMIKNKSTGDLGGGVTRSKTKTMSNLANKTSVTKKTASGPGMKKQRSVVVKSPGERFTYANMGAVSQGKAYRYQAKKNK
jgi:hypothetical protein